MQTERIFLSPRARATILWVAAALLLFFLWQLSGVLTPFVWAIVTAYVLNPVVIFLARRTGVSRRLWSILFYVLLLAFVVVGLSNLGPLIGRQVGELIRELPQHFREAGKLLGQSRVDILGTRIDLNASDEQIRQQMSELLGQFGRNVLPSALPHVAESILKLLVYLVSTFFLLLEADRIGNAIYRFTPGPGRFELGPVWHRINAVLGAYIRGQLFLVVLMATVTYVGLTILGVRFAPLLAIFTGLVETMPFIGPYIAGGTAVLVALTQGSAPYGWSSVTLGIAVAIMYTVLRQLEDNFVMPIVVGRLVHLHPLTVIFAVLAGASLLGILGLLLAVPVAATLKIVISYIYSKFQEEPQRIVVMLEQDDGWEHIAARIREAATLSLSQGAGRPRLLLSVPYPPAVLLDAAQFPRLLDLLKESNADAVMSTDNRALAIMAEQGGIGPYMREGESVPVGTPGEPTVRHGGAQAGSPERGAAT
jgi:predicted PurR-regulated permease PerM